MVISVADAYRVGPNGQVDMDLFQQFANQQQAALTPQGGTGPSAGSPNLTMGQQYLAANPDVFADATARAQAEGIAPGQAFQNRVDQIAREHFDAFGMQEGRSGFGYTPPASGTFAPSPNDNMPFTQNPYSGSMPGPGFQGNANQNYTGTGMPNMQAVNQSYETALNNFGGLLSNYGDFFGGLLSGAQNATSGNMGQNYTGFYGPGQTPVAGGFGSFPAYNFGGFNAGGSWGGSTGGATSGGNTGHRQLWTM
tara:strand:+ start:339 stop:1094 length:756 start_codon:yes stop_codon:yes gene_type:complete